ncbi:Cmx/CmrA family chloramphenicol efflux MFS transporter [Nocardia pseudobrasiliensis]|uniref:DHA1 family chloramphenicol resistance protein-like MFS transporter n=1 Tax=Nocardia pseudobrasiliensis TaxID=45979 RepID=A0A370I8R6_9NOCA|nr:Cmx/CmrA family chloramphenicol efflux MFS transporter [Nocardia pseudobrasiliensis]RDI66501.1 DHA1 family chloramphenicol resistance protein-like MFS transporter [Nocardia pseudobrasiliensis]
MPIVVFALAAAVFAQGTSEFMCSGLLAPIAADTGVSIGTAGLLTSLFAVGMIIGAPTMAVTAGRLPTRRALTGFLLIFLIAHVIGALTTTFAVLLATRAIAAIANAGFLAVALAALPALVGPDRVGRATSVVLAGVTLACIAGVPAGTVLGQLWGWPAALWAVVLVGLPALAALWWLVDSGEITTASGDSVRREWRVLGDSRVRTLLVSGALVNAATFAAFTYLGVLVTDVSGAAAQWISVALAAFGLGSLLGVSMAGRYADRFAERIVVLGAVTLVPLWLCTGWAARSLPALLIAVVLAGALSFAVGSTLIGLIVRHASAAAPRLGGALATTALNIGAAAGPAIAGLAIGDDPRAALWIAAALAAFAALRTVLPRRVGAADLAPAMDKQHRTRYEN